jgi:hypothetical protein
MTINTRDADVGMTTVFPVGDLSWRHVLVAVDAALAGFRQASVNLQGFDLGQAAR